MGILTTLIGNATSDAEVRYTQSGLPVCSFTIAHNERKFNRQTQEWDEGEAQFVRVNVWREQAEHAGASVRKGQRVVAVGKIAMTSYTTKEGETRNQLEMQADEVAVSLRYGTTTYQKAAPKGQRPQAAAVADEPWSPQPAAVGAPQYGDETPF
jgi:single-strand DNA-binding protein